MTMGSSLRLPKLQAIAGKFTAPKANTTAHALRNLAASHVRDPLILQGWVHRKPKKLNKNLTFAKIRDSKGELIQLVDRNNPSLFKNLKPDSTVSVEIRKNGDDLECTALRVLGDANLIPGQLQAEETKEWPGQYRYIQLRQPKFQQILRSRAAIVSTCRSVLNNEGFTEIETPVLFKSTPEGAREFLVPTRRKGLTYALPQSPQQYKQLLIASGIDRYYQVAKCFRDEDLRADRQPEFTQLDLELAFAGVNDVKEVIEKVVRASWRNAGRELVTLTRKNADSSFDTLTYAECIAKYGIDKPDLRSDIQIQRVGGATACRNPAFPVLEAIRIPKRLQPLVEKADVSSPRIHFVTLKNEADLKSEVSRLATFSENEWPQVYSAIESNSEAGDLIAFGDRQELSYENPTPLGRLRQQLIEMDSEASDNDFQNSLQTPGKSIAVWVEKFPSFEPLETAVDAHGYPQYDLGSLKATHHPFTMVDLADYEYLEKGEPLKCHGMHFDLVIDGTEVGGGSQRIHDSDLQRYILKEIVGVESPESLFGHLLGALATGCPPHAGFAIGLDRMVAMLLGLKSIRDVIAFPKTMAGADPVVGSPSKVTPQQLSPYYLKVE